MSRVLVIGDYLIDRYVFYQQQRYDPANSQAPVVKLVSDCVVLGGAGNFVRNLQSLCRGRASVEFFYVDRHKLNDFPTKKRYFIEDKFIYREDSNDKIDHDQDLIDNFISSIKDGDYVVISDYHKGTINESDIERIITRCNELSNVTTFIDTNFVKSCHKRCSWLKINTLTSQHYHSTKNSFDIAKELSNNFCCNTIITRGSTGLSFCSTNRELIRVLKEEDTQFIDSIGAGDACLAGLVAAIIDNKPLGEALIYADVCGHLSTHNIGTVDCLDKMKVDKKIRSIKVSENETSNGVSWLHYE